MTTTTTRQEPHGDSGGRSTRQDEALTVEWFKQRTNYYMQPEMQQAGERAEVLHLRAKSYCAETESGGYVPATVLPMLTPTGWRQRVAALVTVGLWIAVKDGYRIADWDEDQADLEAYAARKRSDRERKRAQRERDRRPDSPTEIPGPSEDASTDSSRDGSRDGHVNVRTQEKEEELNSSSSSPLALVRAARVVEEDEEDQFIAWVRTTRNPGSGAWWRTVAANGDLPDLADQWRTAIAAAVAPATRGARCPIHQLEFPCRSCAADSKVARPDEEWPPPDDAEWPPEAREPADDVFDEPPY